MNRLQRRKPVTLEGATRFALLAASAFCFVLGLEGLQRGMLLAFFFCAWCSWFNLKQAMSLGAAP